MKNCYLRPVGRKSVSRASNYKVFSCSAQLNMKLKLLANTDIAKINGNFRFLSPKSVIYPADEC